MTTTQKTVLIGGGVVAAVAIVLLLLPKKEDFTPKPVPENCITITRDEITNSWLGQGWSSRENPDYVPAIIFEPIAGDPISVAAYPVDQNCNEVPGKKIIMKIGNPTGSRCTFPPGLTLGKTRYDFQKDDVDPFGDLTYFNFLRIIPQADPVEPSRLGFSVEFVRIKDGVEIEARRGSTKPCPPYCPTQQ